MARTICLDWIKCRLARLEPGLAGDPLATDERFARNVRGCSSGQGRRDATGGRGTSGAPRWPGYCVIKRPLLTLMVVQ